MRSALLLGALTALAIGCSNPRRLEVADTLTTSQPSVAGLDAHLGADA